MFNADSKVYESPEISTINVTIEKGFAVSPESPEFEEDMEG